MYHIRIVVRGDGTNKLYKNCNYIPKISPIERGTICATSVNKTKGTHSNSLKTYGFCQPKEPTIIKEPILNKDYELLLQKNLLLNIFNKATTDKKGVTQDTKCLPEYTIDSKYSLPVKTFLGDNITEKNVKRDSKGKIIVKNNCIESKKSKTGRSNLQMLKIKFMLLL